MGIEVFTFPQIKLLKKEGKWTWESADGKLTPAAAVGGRQQTLIVATAAGAGDRDGKQRPETGEQGGGHDQPREGR